jgi:fucose 4-O-acetylase-like acetyltransferase
VSYDRTKSIRTRDITQDVIKGITIILVVYGHMARGLMDTGLGGQALQILDFVLYSFHMPLFFALAGYNTRGVLEHRSAATYVRSRWWAVAYPYVVWSILLGGFKLLVQTLPGTDVNHPVDVTDLVAIGWKPIAPYWFLYALLLMQLILAAWWRKPGLLLAAAITGFVAAGLWDEHMPAIVRATLLHAPFFMLGAWLAASERMPAVYALMARPGILLGLLAVVAVGFWLPLQWPELNPVGLLTLPLSLAGMGMMTGLAQRVPEGLGRQIFAYLGRLSLPIFLAHVIFTAMTRAIMLKLGVDMALPLLVVGTLVGVAAPIALYEVAARLRMADWLGLTARSPMPARA